MSQEYPRWMRLLAHTQERLYAAQERQKEPIAPRSKYLRVAISQTVIFLAALALFLVLNEAHALGGGRLNLVCWVAALCVTFTLSVVYFIKFAAVRK